MEKITVRYEPTTNTVQLLFADVRQMAYLSPIEDKTPGDFHLMKNEAGEVMGIECMFYHLPPGSFSLDIETLSGGDTYAQP